MKKKIFSVLGIAIVLALLYLVGSGFMKNTSAFITEYSVSDDGKEITIHVGVASSAGYIRDVKVHQQQGGKLDLDCYCAFGGFNGSIGAKDTFTFELEDETNVIAVYRNTNAYEAVLVKESDGSWQRVQ